VITNILPDELGPPLYPEVVVELSRSDGNVYSVIGSVKRALQRAGVPEAEIRGFTIEAFAAGSYDGVLATAMRWVEVL
jgi:hypothetical protein